MKTRRRGAGCALGSLVFLGATGLFPSSGDALIMVRSGNDPVANLGWPAGSEDVANLDSRLGYWEGPPFGGGLYCFLYRCGDTDEFNEALKVFSAVRAKRLELAIHDGPKEDTHLETRVDWEFVIWRPENWHRLFNDLTRPHFSTHPGFRQPVPAPTITVYIGGGSITWTDAMVPDNVVVTDKRAQAAPVKPIGGGVIRGDVFDMTTGQPIAGAEMSLVRHTGDRKWEQVAKAKADDQGVVRIKRIPKGYYRIRIRAEGYAARAYEASLGYPNRGTMYFELAAELMPPSILAGIVVDAKDEPIPGVRVQARNTLGIDGLGYSCPDVHPVTTDAQGRFALDGLPRGFTGIRCRKGSLQQQTSIHEIYAVPPERTPEIRMIGTGMIRGKVVDENGRVPDGEIHVHLQAVDAALEKWGRAQLCKEDGGFAFANVPPGAYRISSNPRFLFPGGKDDARKITVRIGETTTLELVHRPDMNRRPAKRTVSTKPATED